MIQSIKTFNEEIVTGHVIKFHHEMPKTAKNVKYFYDESLNSWGLWSNQSTKNLKYYLIKGQD